VEEGERVGERERERYSLLRRTLYQDMGRGNMAQHAIEAALCCHSRQKFRFIYGH
jgi:hypothetical protein